MTSTVKTPLTPRPRRRDVVDNDAYGAFARRVGNGDVEALPDMFALSAALDESISQAVHGLRGFGYSWAEIGHRLGLTRQAVHQRSATTGGDRR